MTPVFNAFRLGGNGAISVYVNGLTVIAQGRADNGLPFNLSKDYTNEEEVQNELNLIQGKCIFYGLTFIV